MKSRQLPYGVQDYLPGECYNKYGLEKRLSEVFYGYGYDRIEPAGIEYIETFSASNTNKLFKLIDSDGSLLSLRSDPTVQISRIAATNAGISRRLYYMVNSYEYLMNSQSARTREFSQAGIELLGDGKDAEAIIVAVDALKKLGFKKFKIDIGQVNYFRGIIEGADISAEYECELISLINNKNVIGINDFIADGKINASYGDALRGMTGLFGGVEVIARAEKLCSNKLCKLAVDNIKDIFDVIKKVGILNYVSIDLGLIPDSYYTGIVLRGYVDGLGLAVLDGGRYDALSSRFGADISAVGWALGIKRLMTVLDREGKLEPVPAIDYAFITDESSQEFCSGYIAAERAKGKRAIGFYCKKSELLTSAAAQNIKTALIFKDGKVEKIELKG